MLPLNWHKQLPTEFLKHACGLQLITKADVKKSVSFTIVFIVIQQKGVNL